MYNSMRISIFAIYELWPRQTFQDYHEAPKVYWVNIKAFEILLVRGKHLRHKIEYTYRDVGIMRDGYLQRQIFDLTHQV